MTQTALDLLKKRRTQYALGRNVTQDKAAITALIEEAIRQAPSSFNSQSSRAVILFGDENVRFWKLVEDALREVAPAEGFERTVAKLQGFAAGVGTVLFYEDQDTVKALQEQFPLYADAFPAFSEHSAGMAQYAVWLTLADAGIGASLQHYNPVVDARAAETWKVPASWKLRAQMPFGSNEAPIGDKTFIDDAKRFIVAG
jgi:predicted oxidoreductase (fatty acid repression mutant protein)